MTVTDIVEISGGKYKVFIDNEFSFVLYRGELRTFKIEKDHDISIQDYNEIINNILPKRAKLRAMHLLEKRPYTEWELRKKLKDGLYGEEIMDTAIEYVKSYGYVDDLAYVRQYIYTYKSSKSIKQMEQKLLEKGISKRIIQDGINEAAELGETPDERELIRELMRKKNYNPDTADEKQKSKMARFLYGKGFASELIWDIL